MTGGNRQAELSTMAEGVATFAVMTNENCNISSKKRDGGWVVVARLAGGSEHVAVCESWNEAQKVTSLVRQAVNTLCKAATPA